MDTILEQMRSLYEERDRIELAVVNEMNSKKAGHKEKLHSEHRQNALIERYMRCSKKLLALHEDQAKKPPEEPKDMDAVFEEFYREVKKIKDYYATHPEKNVPVYTLADEFEDIEASRQMVCNPKPSTSIQEPENLEEDAPEKDGEIDRLTRGLPAKDLVEIVQPTTAPARTEPLIQFTDEEGNGRYLDLHHCYNAFLQVIKHEENKPRYLEYLNSFDQFENLDRKLKLTSQYNTYLNELLNYFRDYSRRAKPLLDCEEMESKTEDDFTSRWASKCVPGWFQESDREAAKGAEMIDLNIYRSAEELMELGLECLKNDLQARGLKCGGTLEERAQRLWSVKGKATHEIDDSLRAGTKKGKKRGIDPMKIALLEAKIFTYTDLYTDHRQATIENVQRKQARTAEERDESDEDISDIDDDDNDEGDVIYNPKNLPLGWDGKPIPYWLYKLHGLNITFTCEICGNATYKGPKTFQRHFAEWRHAHGMRCLGIPNTAHFANITKIEDAINLWDKLKNERQKEKFQPQNEEEFEDSLGNVVNKKTYEDLKRQGLL